MKGSFWSKENMRCIQAINIGNMQANSPFSFSSSSLPSSRLLEFLESREDTHRRRIWELNGGGRTTKPITNRPTEHPFPPVGSIFKRSAQWSRCSFRTGKPKTLYGTGLPSSAYGREMRTRKVGGKCTVVSLSFVWGKENALDDSDE